MGQRLCVTIVKDKRDLAKLYYHWSGYTYNALYETRNIIDCIYSHQDETEKDLQLRLIRFCEENGGGITCTKEYHEHEYIQNLFPNETFKTEDVGRSNGLIAISEKGMLGMQRWSEGDVYINLDEGQVDFCVYCGYENLTEYIEERKSWDEDFDEKELVIPEFDFDLGYFDVNDIDAIIASLDTTDAHIIKCNGEICEIIE